MATGTGNKICKPLGIDSFSLIFLTSETFLVLFSFLLSLSLSLFFPPVEFPSQLASCRHHTCISSSITFFPVFQHFYFLHWSSTSGRVGQTLQVSRMFLSMQRQIQQMKLKVEMRKKPQEISLQKEFCEHDNKKSQNSKREGNGVL